METENEGADCQIPSLPDEGSPPTVSRLPGPFTTLDGTRITSTSDWRCRREEVKRPAEKFVHGEKPPKPSGVTGTVSRTSITVNVSYDGRSASFSAGVDLPSSDGPFPAVVVLGGFGADTAAIKAAGAAVITYDPLAAGREGTPRDDWLAARSASVAALGGAEIYKALGAEGDTTYWSAVQDGTHCASRSEWRMPLQQNIQKLLLGTGGYTGSMRIAANRSGDLAEWRDRQTPVLSDGGTSQVSGTVQVATVTFTLPAGHRLAGSWNGAAAVSGQTVTISNVGHNGTLAPGASIGGVGFQADRPDGDTSLPSGYTCA